MGSLPTPRVLYLYNDIPYLAPPADDAHLWRALLDELLTLLRAQPHVRFLEVEPLIAALAVQTTRGPYARTLAIGSAGRRVAELLHERTGWFPAIAAIPLTRVEQSDGGYRVVSRGPLDADLLLPRGPLAIVDDTIYSGQTISWLLDRLPPGLNPDLFCLQGVRAALVERRLRCRVFAGVELAGERETDLSVIKVSHLFEPGAIRTPTGDLAFYERRQWMDAWFPDGANAIIAVCARLRHLTPDPFP